MHSSLPSTLAALLLMAAALLTACSPAKQPPFSLGSQERVAEILKTFVEVEKDSYVPVPASEKLKTYLQAYQAGAVKTRKVSLAGSEIVVEEVLFTVPKGRPLTGQGTVRSVVSWPATWTQGTIQQMRLPDTTPINVTLYSSKHDGWVAKLYAVDSMARLVVMKSGISGLDIDQLVPTHIELTEKMKEVMKRMQTRLEKDKAAKDKP